MAFAAAVLSFASLRHLAIVCGTSSGLAWLLPVCIDAAALVATRVWLTGKTPERARSVARTLALTMIVLSVAGNGADHALAAYAVVPPWWAVVAVAAIPPAVLGAVAHLAALVVTTPPTSTPTADAASAGSPAAGLVERARYLVAAGEAEGVKVGRGRLAAQLGISENQARELLRQIATEQGPKLRTLGSEAQ